MEKVLNGSGQLIFNLASMLDRARFWILARTMRIGLLRRIYGSCSLRLVVTFFFLTLLYFPISLRRPDVLLVVGPFLSGYMHLVASYWFIQKKSEKQRSVPTIRIIHLLTVVTAFSMGSQWLAKKYGLTEGIPFGAWEVAVAAIALIVMRLVSKSLSLRDTIICLAANFTILHLAWRDPILFVGAVLILHNWVAFIYWIMVAKGRTRKSAAIVLTLVFGLIHIMVFNGAVDYWLPVTNGSSFPGNAEITGWYLASWSDDPIIWYRALVLYAYGISMHYFVWLKAIPESSSKNERPNCFRATLQQLRRDFGSGFLVIGAAGVLIGMLIWSLSFSLGQVIYFGIAALHGWLEITFLLCWIGSSRLRLPQADSTILVAKGNKTVKFANSNGRIALFFRRQW